ATRMSSASTVHARIGVPAKRLPRTPARRPPKHLLGHTGMRSAGDGTRQDRIAAVASRLHAQAFRWIAWATVSQVGRDLLRIVTRLVLARLLWPDDFGIFTLAFTIVLGVQVCTELQMR